MVFLRSDVLQGIIGKKVGMTQIFTPDGRWFPVTVIQAGPCQVVQLKTADKDGYSALQIGYEEKKNKKVNKPLLGHFSKNSLKPNRYLREFKVDDVSVYNIGQSITVEVLKDVKTVDISGVTRGQGFQGVMKRHGFGGGRATHGCTTHRSPGSIGQHSQPSRVFKNMKMAGQTGNVNRTVQNLEVVGIDSEKNLLLVRGCVPGGKRGLLTIRKSKKGK
jgi:large subunit ribosomal protein L3